jgi:hypothetical protein
MKVKIINADPFDWYANMVGKEFEVKLTPQEIGVSLFDKPHYIVYKDSHKYYCERVDETDVVVVEEQVEIAVKEEDKEVIEAKTSKVKGKQYKTIIDPNNPDCYFYMVETSKTITVYLKLASETKKRKLGMVTKSTKTFHITRNRIKHLHIKTNSYGFNDYLIRNAKEFDTIELQDELKRWKFPKNFVIDNGVYLFFKKEGFELQKFVPLELLKTYEQKNII